MICLLTESFSAKYVAVRGDDELLNVSLIYFLRCFAELSFAVWVLLIIYLLLDLRIRSDKISLIT